MNYNQVSDKIGAESNPSPMETGSSTNPLTAADLGRRLGRSTTTIKRLATALHLPDRRTGSNIRVFTGDDLEKISREIQRRAQEDAR